MHAYSKPLGRVTLRSGRILGFTKISMAMAIPAIPLPPGLCNIIYLYNLSLIFCILIIHFMEALLQLWTKNRVAIAIKMI